MSIEVILAIILTVGLLIMSIKKLKGFKINTKSISRIGIMAAVTILLNMIKLVPFPQGGGFSLLSALPCTLTYEYIGKTLKDQFNHNISDNYYGPWIEAYAGVDFEDFSIRSLEFVDSICKNINEKEEEKLINIFLKACEYEMKFWDMSYE